MNTMSRNVRLYPWYIFFRDCLFWGPAFFLYFSSVIPLSQVLWLEAVYYIGVAVFEVPSGYISDRMGRRPTLLFSALCLTTAYLLFFFGGSFWIFAIAQLLLASGFACASGTDTALHFESLKELGREQEFVMRETRALKLSFIAGAIGALVGGALALFSLKTVYLASAMAGTASIVVLFCFAEPAVEKKQSMRGFVRQVPFLLRKSWSKNLRFFTLFSASMTMMVHVPYEFYQPYIEKLALPVLLMGEGTPLVTGVHLAVTMLIGSWCTRFVAPLSYHCRVRASLLGCLAFQVLMVGLMSFIIHPLIAALLLARTGAKAIASPLVNGELAPQLEKNERSTYLSILSLMGRLLYGVALLVMSFSTSFFQDAFQGAVVCAFIMGALLLGAVRCAPFPRETKCQCCSTHDVMPGGEGAKVS